MMGRFDEETTAGWRDKAVAAFDAQPAEALGLEDAVLGNGCIFLMKNWC